MAVFYYWARWLEGPGLRFLCLSVCLFVCLFRVCRGLQTHPLLGKGGEPRIELAAADKEAEEMKMKRIGDQMAEVNEAGVSPLREVAADNSLHCILEK